MRIDVWVKRLQSPDRGMRLQAIEMLGNLGQAEALGPLAALFFHESDPAVRQAAQMTAKSIYYNLHLQHLTALLDTQPPRN
jgi:HEAT repeat protein